MREAKINAQLTDDGEGTQTKMEVEGGSYEVVRLLAKCLANIIKVGAKEEGCEEKIIALFNVIVMKEIKEKGGEETLIDLSALKGLKHDG